MGAGATITYAVVTQELNFAKARNCAGIGPVHSILSANHLKPGRKWQSYTVLASHLLWWFLANGLKPPSPLSVEFA